MESRAKLLGHPIHPMLIVLPLGLFISAVVFDALYLWRGSATFAAVAYWNIAGGIIGGLLACGRDWIHRLDGDPRRAACQTDRSTPRRQQRCRCLCIRACLVPARGCTGFRGEHRGFRRRGGRFWRWEASPAGLAASWWTALAWEWTTTRV
jgi:hypothetical protein